MVLAKLVFFLDYMLLQGGRTALHIACESGNTEAVKYLIQANADLNVTDEVCGIVCMTLLTIVLCCCCISTIFDLLCCDL